MTNDCGLLTGKGADKADSESADAPWQCKLMSPGSLIQNAAAPNLIVSKKALLDKREQVRQPETNCEAIT